MRKAELSLKKSAGARNLANKSQQKISSFFVKALKDETHKSKDNSTTNIKANAFIDSTHKKRKITEDSELQEIHSKVTKYKDTSDACNAYRKQERSPYKNVPEKKLHTHKENIINTPKTLQKSPVKSVESASCVEAPIKDLPLHDSNFVKDPCVRINKTYTPTDSQDVDISSSCNTKLSECSVGPFKNSKKLAEFDECCDKTDLALGACVMDDFDEFFEEEWSTDAQINFNSLQRCKVIDVKREYKVTTLTVEHEDFTSTAVVMCSGFWKDARVEKDNIVAIQAKKEAQYWVVDNNNGFLVVHSDLLISGTTIVGALFCSRKAVLAEKFRKMESLPYYEGDQTAMVIGSLAHQLLQKAIRQNIRELSDVNKLVDCILQSRETTSLLYASEITFNECQQQLQVFAPKIFEFIQHYMKGKKQQQIDNVRGNFKGRIIEIHDIEENIWLPKLGIKGKVDATVEVSINSKRKIMPLEIKTGRPSFSLEHKGQIILYIMMMALTGQDTDTGLLLYLRENNMQEINSGHPERRDLILLRNTLANYFASKPLEKTSESEWPTMELPEPINHHSACNKCSYNALCCMYLNKDPNLQLSESHPLTKISKQILQKFKSSHIDYVVKWVSLLQIEESAQSADSVLKYMWTLSPEKREAKGTCICNLKVIGRVTERDSKYQHMFVRANEQIMNSNITHMNFSENEYVIVSIDARINISAGFIMHIKEDSIAVLLDRDITKYNVHGSFHIDKYSSSSLYSFNLANIGGLMGDDETCTKLRDIVIDRKPATFIERLPRSIVSNGAKILNDLNENQQRAVLKAMAAEEYVLIKGMPGTGKTQTLVALINLLHDTGFSVLVTAHTNSAVDNILLKLIDKGLDFLRLGSTSSIHQSLRHKTEGYATANCHSPESLEQVYSSKNIIGVTCYGAHHALLGRRSFDVCVVDESAQAMQPAVLRPLYSARKFILVGDPEQLPPIIKSKKARKLGADESLFVRLDSENNTVNLTKQYRMNKNIMKLANKLTYHDQLEAGSTLIENATFSALHSESLVKQEKWIQRVLSQDINESVTVLNTGCTYNLKVNHKFNQNYPESDQTYSNIWEAAVISRLLQTLVQMGVNPKNIGVIAPYRAHVILLKKIAHKEVEVNTVDQYQGRDKEIILYSCARSLVKDYESKGDFEILGDHRRLTVAITRAKHKLIVIADKCTLSQYTPFKRLFDLVEEKNFVNLNEGCDDFSWEKIVTLL